MRAVALLAVAQVACFDFSASVLPNSPPVAVVAEPVIAVEVGESVLLDGSGSTDADGDELSFSWSQVDGSGPPVSLQDATSTVASFSAPPSAAPMFFRLVVSDGIDASGPAIVEVQPTNRAPVVSPLDPIVVTAGQEVLLIAEASDADNNPITFLWSLLDWPERGEVALLNRTEDTARFTPSVRSATTEPAQCDQGDCYLAEVRAHDGHLWSEPETITVVSLNRPPVAYAGEDYAINSPVLLLDGSNSADPDGDDLEYEWSLVEGPTLLEAETSWSGEVVSVRAAEAGNYVFELVVDDGVDTSLADSVRITIDSINTSPTVTAPNEALAVEGTVANLSVTATDAEGDPIAVIWTRTAGNELWPPALAGTDVDIPVPSFKTLALGGDSWARYRVIATDGFSASPAVFVTVFALPDESNFVFLSADGVDADGCGSLAAPCRGLRKSLAEAGTGDIVGTVGYFETPTSDQDPVTWVAGVSLLGGRDPINFSQSTPSLVRIVSGTLFNTGIHFNIDIGPDVVVHNVALGAIKITHRPMRIINCWGCQAQFVDSEILGAQGQAINSLHLQNGADVRVRNTKVLCGDIDVAHTCVRLQDGSHLEFIGGRVELTATTAAVKQFAVELDGGTSATFEGTIVRLTGPTSGENRRAFSNGGNLELSSSVVQVTAGEASTGVHNTGTLSAHANTIIGAGHTSGSGAALYTEGAANVANCIAAQFPLAADLRGAGTQSLLFGNAFWPSGSDFASCDETPVTEGEFLNASTRSTCNQGFFDWSDNIAAVCPLLNPAGDDFHLNGGIANPCVDAGVAVSPAGAAPLTDIDGDLRPTAELDIGADEYTEVTP